MSSIQHQIIDRIRAAQTIALVIHQRPDGDAVGSAVALSQALKTTGKNIHIVCIQDIPKVFTAIVGSVSVESVIPAATDCLIILDCAELHRTGFGRQIQDLSNRIPVAVIDHHDPGDLQKITSLYHSRPEAAATAELVYDYLADLHMPVTPSIATAILMAVYTDTGGFQHGNTTSRTFQLSARLVRCGANLSAVSQGFLRTFNPGKKRLWGSILARVRLNRWGIVSAVINSDDLIQAEATAEDILGLANTLALTYEARAALVMVEVAGSWRGILRTRHATVDVSQLAELFGGKGQKKAAGFTATKSVFSGKIER